MPLFELLHHRRRRRCKPLQQNPADRISDPDPDNSRAIGIGCFEENEILVLCNDDRTAVRRALPDCAIQSIFQTERNGMRCFITLPGEPCRERWR
jgi:hypothetical protein